MHDAFGSTNYPELISRIPYTEGREEERAHFVSHKMLRHIDFLLIWPMCISKISN